MCSSAEAGELQQLHTFLQQLCGLLSNRLLRPHELDSQLAHSSMLRERVRQAHLALFKHKMTQQRAMVRLTSCIVQPLRSFIVLLVARAQWRSLWERCEQLLKDQVSGNLRCCGNCPSGRHAERDLLLKLLRLARPPTPREWFCGPSGDRAISPETICVDYQTLCGLHTNAAASWYVYNPRTVSPLATDSHLLFCSPRFDYAWTAQIHFAMHGLLDPARLLGQ